MNRLITTTKSTVQPTQILLDNDQKTWWDSLSQGQRNFIVNTSIALGVSVLVVIGLLLLRREYRKIRSNQEEQKSFGSDKHATWAKQFKQAFDNDGWWGTDVPLVRSTMRSIPSKEDFKLVEKSYKKQYHGAILIRDMADELTKMEYEEMLAIIGAKPQNAKDAKPGNRIYDPKGWARRIHAAISYTWLGFLPGTDEEAIVAVFQEFPNRNAFYATATQYKSMYGKRLSTALDEDLDWSLDWRKLLKPKTKK